MPAITTSIPKALRPFFFHGLNLSIHGEQAIGDCPFCGHSGKFSVALSTGVANCWTCTLNPDSPKGGLNAVSFIKRVWEESDKRTNGQSNKLSDDRGFLRPDTVTHWGVAQSFLTGDWVVPGFDAEGKLHQLYRWVPRGNDGKRTLLPTPGLWEDGKAHGMHGINLFDPQRELLFVAEGPWDAMAMWETLEMAGRKDANVIAMPGCRVFARSWLPLFAGKIVVLMFDSDQPTINEGKIVEGAAIQGARRAAGMLLGAGTPPQSVAWLQWGEQGFDKSLPSGFDVRDWLTPASTEAERVKRLDALLAKVQPIPSGWAEVKASHGGGLEPRPCQSWLKVVGAWKEALHWRQPIEDALTAMLAVGASTLMPGDQVFLQVIGDAGSAKSRLCDALLVSKRCHQLDHLTGFFSGMKSDNGDDYSLANRVKGKLMVTSEGDVIMSNPRNSEIMSQQRRMYDGSTTTTYKNRKEDVHYDDMRTPWIMAGTPALLDMDQSRLGDRFVRIVIASPSDEERRKIVRTSRMTQLRAMMQVAANGEGGSILPENLREAYRLTSGYLEWLWDNARSLLKDVVEQTDEDAVGVKIDELAEFAADMRARPHSDKRKEDTHDTKELPTRLSNQFTRMAYCIAVVQNRPRVDAQVLRLVRKLALDTARGRTLELCNLLSRCERAAGATVNNLSVWTMRSTESVEAYLRFLSRKQIGVVESFHKDGSNQLYWRLTEQFSQLHKVVHDV